MAGEAGGSAENTATAGPSDRLLRVQAGLIGAGLFVTDADGVVQRATTDDPPAEIPLTRLTRGTGSGATSGVLRSATGARLLVVSAQIDDGHRLVAVQGLREIRQTQAGILAIGLVALLAAALVAYVAGGVLARRLTAPLVRLETAAESVAEGAFGTQVDRGGRCRDRIARTLLQPHVHTGRRRVRGAEGVRRRRLPRDPHAAHLDPRVRRGAARRHGDRPRAAAPGARRDSR